MKTRSLCLLVLFLGSQGCAADAADQEPSDAEAEQDYTSVAALKAQVTTQSFSASSGACAAQGSFLQVSLPSRRATSRINTTLDRKFGDYYSAANCQNVPYKMKAKSRVTYNERGLLSVVESRSEEANGRTRTQMGTRTFDMRTGRSIELVDIVGPSGMAYIEEGCVSWMLESLDTELEALAKDACVQATHSTNMRGGGFTMEASGVRIYPTSLPYFAPATEGVLFDWVELKAFVKHPLVKMTIR